MKTKIIALVMAVIAIPAFANINDRPTLKTMPKTQKAILTMSTNQPQQKVLIKVKDDLNRTIQEFELKNFQNNYVFNFDKADYGTYFIDVFHGDMITRKHINVNHRGVQVLQISELKEEEKPFSQWVWHPYHE